MNRSIIADIRYGFGVSVLPGLSTSPDSLVTSLLSDENITDLFSCAGLENGD